MVIRLQHHTEFTWTDAFTETGGTRTDEALPKPPALKNGRSGGILGIIHLQRKKSQTRFRCTSVHAKASNQTIQVVSESPNPSWAKSPAGRWKANSSIEVMLLENGIFLDTSSLQGDFSSLVDVPLVDVFLLMVHNCKLEKDLVKAKHLHLHMCYSGLDTYDPICNYSVPMFVECGSLSDAKQVFSRLASPNEYSWTSLVMGYSDRDQLDCAFYMFHNMNHIGVHASSYTLVSLLKVCAELKDIHRGQEIHKEIAVDGYEGNLFVGNTLIDMYGKCSFLLEAQELFKELPHRDIVSWNAVIAAYGESGCLQEAFYHFEQMQIEGILPNIITMSSLLKACSREEAISEGQNLHMEVINRGIQKDILLDTSLVDMYANCGLLPVAQKLFDEVKYRDVVLWTALLEGYAEHGPYGEAIRCFEQMQVEGFPPNGVTFTCVLKACSSGRCIDKGRQIHSTIVSLGFEQDTSIGNTIIDMYAKCGFFSDAEETFDNLKNQDVISWNALITAYTDYQRDEEAVVCFNQLHADGMCPTHVTLSSVLKSCGNIGALCKGLEAHTSIVCMGFESRNTISTSLIEMYARLGFLFEAQGVFDRLPIQDIAAWTAIMQAYVINYEGKRAVHCFENMQKHGVVADATAFTCILTACGQSRMLSVGHQYFRVMREKYGVAATKEHYICMIDLLAKSGHLYEAEKFIEMQCPLSYGTWSALFNACKIFEDVELGLRCFQQLVHIDPDKYSLWLVRMTNLYKSAGRQVDVYMLENIERHIGLLKCSGEVEWQGG